MRAGLGVGGAQDLGRQLDRRRPPTRDHVQRAGDLVGARVDARGDERPYLVPGEGEVGRAEVEDLAAPAQTRHEERRLVA